jgi:hypothetical protein
MRSFFRLLLPFMILVFVLASVVATSAQDSIPTAERTRPRTVTKQPVPPTAPVQNQVKPASTPYVLSQPKPTNAQTMSTSSGLNGGLSGVSNSTSTTSSPPVATVTTFPTVVLPAKTLSVDKVRSRLTEALRLLKNRPVPTALTTPSLYQVTITALDPDHSKVHLLSIPKTMFLDLNTDTITSTSNGTPVRFRVVRSNYVNTAVLITDLKGHQFIPLVVEYPIEKFGSFKEMAYYSSAHPAIVTSDLVKYGQSYVRSMVDLAAKQLKERGIIVSDPIIDMAERLCIVEHVDHDRFLTENRKILFEEVFSLYGLNELNTYRYSVSSAGAGGMVQMIAPTYRFIRERYSHLGLNPDFVAGMRDHLNALKAMLLYMNDTWRDLTSNMEVNYALSSGIATQQELLAAGYNSNPAKLPSYLRRGGTGWRNLIPRETQMYLQINQSLNSLVTMTTRSQINTTAQNQSSTTKGVAQPANKSTDRMED